MNAPRDWTFLCLSCGAVVALSRLFSLCSWVSGHLDLDLGIWVSGYLGIWVSGYLGIWVSGYLGIWVSGYLGIWVSGYLGIWVSGYLGIWVSGYLGIWVSGYLGTQYPVPKIFLIIPIFILYEYAIHLEMKDALVDCHEFYRFPVPPLCSTSRPYFRTRVFRGFRDFWGLKN